nr:hypothetical protein [Bacillus pumilus]
MLKSYYFIHTKNDHGQYVVHIEDCAFLGDAASRTLIGLHMNCESAMEEAKKMTMKLILMVVFIALILVIQNSPLLDSVVWHMVDFICAIDDLIKEIHIEKLPIYSNRSLSRHHISLYIYFIFISSY